SIGQVQCNYFHTETVGHLHRQKSATAARIKYEFPLQLFLGSTHSFQEKLLPKFDILSPVSLTKLEHLPLQGEGGSVFLQEPFHFLRKHARYPVHNWIL